MNTARLISLYLAACDESWGCKPSVRPNSPLNSSSSDTIGFHLFFMTRLRNEPNPASQNAIQRRIKVNETPNLSRLRWNVYWLLPERYIKSALSKANCLPTYWPADKNAKVTYAPPDSMTRKAPANARMHHPVCKSSFTVLSHCEKSRLKSGLRGLTDALADPPTSYAQFNRSYESMLPSFCVVNIFQREREDLFVGSKLA